MPRHSKRKSSKNSKRKSLRKGKEISIPWGILRRDPTLRALNKELKTKKSKKEIQELILKYGGKQHLKQLVLTMIRKNHLSYSGVFKTYGESLDKVNWALLFSGIGIPLLAFTVPAALVMKTLG
jgi:hypothetical protein